MYGWLIVLIAAAIILVGVIIWNCVDAYSDYALDCAFSILVFVAIIVTILGILNVAVFVGDKNFSEQVKVQQEIFDKSLSGFDSGNDYTVMKTVIEVNQDIYRARNSKEIWGNWSMYYYVPEEVLVPVTLKKD